MLKYFFMTYHFIMDVLPIVVLYVIGFLLIYRLVYHSELFMWLALVFWTIAYFEFLMTVKPVYTVYVCLSLLSLNIVEKYFLQ